MKKFHHSPVWMIFDLRAGKILMIMKLTLCLVLITIFQAMAIETYSQKTRISLNATNIGLEEALSKIEDQSEFYFLYSTEFVNLDKKVNVSLENKRITEILDNLFQDTEVTYVIKDRQIVLSSTNYYSTKVEAIGQQPAITGTVIDATGDPLPGVTVVVKGTTKGTTSGNDGSFVLQELLPDAILMFSFVGMKTQEVAVNGRSFLNVVMEEDAIGIEEVVAIGYGTQKKANLTGATTIVRSDELIKRPVSDGASLLQGRVAGLNIIQNSGQPGDEGQTIQLRGIGSFGNTAPYVLIDGIEGVLSAINPNDIESFTVLKDAASAAIYGARAANGVILITTKSGKNNDLAIEASANIGVQYATRLPDFIYNSVEYMELWNKGAEHTGVSARYSQDLINAYKNASPNDPKYPNFNWMNHMFNGGLRHDYQVSARGGGENNTFFVNLGIIDQEGIMDRYGLKKYSGRINMDFDVNDNISMGVKTGIVYQDIEEPTVESIYEQMLYIYTMPPTMAPYTWDGAGHHTARDIPQIWRNRNPQMVLDNPGGTYYDKYQINTQAYIDIHPFKGFSWKTTAAWRYDRTEKEHSNFDMDGYIFTTNEYWGKFEANTTGVYNDDYRSSNLYLNSVVNYNLTLDDGHNIDLIAGYEQQEMNYDRTYVYRPKYSSVTTTDIDAGSPDGQSVNGNTSSWALQSFFGRLSYNYKGRYLAEANLRYDGTSKIAKDNRWDLFPSMSVGWRISEEGFLGDISWLDNLKFRLSVGQLGNQGVLTDYPYQELLSPSIYPIDGNLESGISNVKLSNPALVWETVTSYNLGVDFSMKNGLFGFELDLYKKITEGGHDVAQIPASVGKFAPQENYKNMENKGVELILRHANKVGEVKYTLSFIFDKYVNKITKVKDNYWASTWYGRSAVEGHPINQYYMLDWIGIYQNQQEVDNLPIYAPYAAQTQPGDLIFRDVNGDGKITIEGETGDRIFIDGYHPKFSYSFTGNFEWKNFDLSMFWQGVAGKKNLARWIGYEPFMQGGPVTTRWRDAWDGEGSTNSMPALYNMANYGYNPISGRVSDFYLHNASYLRLKNLQVGYSLPPSICDKLGVDRLRLYVSGDNLITISDFAYDPERGSNNFTANTYPQLKTYSIGAKLTF